MAFAQKKKFDAVEKFVADYGCLPEEASEEIQIKECARLIGLINQWGSKFGRLFYLWRDTFGPNAKPSDDVITGAKALLKEGKPSTAKVERLQATAETSAAGLQNIVKTVPLPKSTDEQDAFVVICRK